MGQLYDAIQSVESVIRAKGLEPNEMRGLIGMKAGFFLIIITRETPDDPERLSALRRAAEELLGEKMPF